MCYETIDVVTFTWKRLGIEYGAAWLYYYRLASRCLSTQLSPVMNVAQFDFAGRNNVDFSYFEKMILCCRSDFIYHYTNVVSQLQ